MHKSRKFTNTVANPLRKKHRRAYLQLGGAFSEVGAEGLENESNSLKKRTVAKKLTPNPTPLCFDDADVNALIEAWPTLDDDTKAALLNLAGIRNKA